MPARRDLLRAAMGAGALSGLGACASARTVGYDPARRSLDIENGGEPLTLDPHKATGTWENNVIGNMFVGLVTEDAAAGVIPGMATHWETSEDGLSWIFHLREAYWSDGHACNAHDFAFAYQRILDPNNFAEYASLLYPIKNAEAVNQGRMPPNQVGVFALDDRTLEIQLEHPTPYLLEMLKHQTSFPAPKHAVLAHGDAWIKPENIVVNGPYKLEKWWSNYIIHLRKNRSFFDVRNVWLEDLYFYPSPDSYAAARSVITGERGWSTGFPSIRVDTLRRDAPGAVRTSPFLLVSYLSFNMGKAPFNDARVRRAFAMAVDRAFIARAFFKCGEAPAYSFVPPGIANYRPTPRFSWAAQPMPQRIAEARALLEAAGYGPSRPLNVEYSYRSSGDNGRIAVAIQSDWSQIAPWVNIALHAVEAQVHYANLRAKNFTVGDGGWVADFNDAKNYLYLLETRTGSQNYPGFSNPEFDRLMAQSDLMQDMAARAELMAQAEQIALDEAPICPTIFGVSKNLVNPRIDGFADNLVDIHRARFFRDRGA